MRRRKKIEPRPILSPDDSAIRQQMHKETYDELVRKQISNSENFDKAILTLSTSALGLSLAFIKDFVPLATANYKPSLYTSWILFMIAVISTIGSYITSQQAISLQLVISNDYYINRNDDALTQSNPYSSATKRLNYLAGFSFIAALASTIQFVINNLN